MADKQLKEEERVLRNLIPWLSLQLGDELEWSGRPEDEKHYKSRCPSAMNVRCRLDAELTGNSTNVVVEHTTVEAFPKQPIIFSVLAGLRHHVLPMRELVPRGNSVTLSVSTDCVRCNKLKWGEVNLLIPDLVAKLTEYLPGLPKDPAREEAIRGYQLEEPLLWQFGRLEIRVTRYWRPGGSHISCRLELNDADWKTGLLNCLGSALESTVGGKSSSYEAYRSEGWLALVVIELADFQISSIESAAEAFRLLAGGLDLRSVDGIVLVESGAADETPLCCWAYFRGEVRSAKQQKAEFHQCLGLAPNA